VWTAGVAARLAGVWQCLPPLLHVLIEPAQNTAREALATVSAIDAVLDASGVGGPRLYRGQDATARPVNEAALERGRDVRVGFEDTL